MNDDYLSIMKVFAANVTSWVATATAIKLADISIVVGILAGMGSIAVSIYSVRWIRQQMRALEAKKNDASRG